MQNPAKPFVIKKIRNSSRSIHTHPYQPYHSNPKQPAPLVQKQSDINPKKRLSHHKTSSSQAHSMTNKLILTNQQRIRLHLVSLLKPPKTSHSGLEEGHLNVDLNTNMNSNDQKKDGRHMETDGKTKKMQTSQSISQYCSPQLGKYNIGKNHIPTNNNSYIIRGLFKNGNDKLDKKLQKLNDIQVNFSGNDPTLNHLNPSKRSNPILPKLQTHPVAPNNQALFPFPSILTTQPPPIRLRPSSKPYHLTTISSAHSKPGSNGKGTKTNQDTSIIQTSLPLGIKLFAVCDGHGANGHLVSEFIKQILPKNLATLLKKYVHAIALNGKDQTEDKGVVGIFKDAFHRTNQALLNSDINTELSGSTVIGIFVYKNTIYCLNVGDSRAILSSVSASTTSMWQTKALSSDQTPQRQDQRKRIINFGGAIKRQHDEKGQQVGPQRVWRKDLHLPGLAMTRSFGDKAGMKAGTNGEPEITEHIITKDDIFITIASDGVWEYLDNEEVTELIASCFENKENLGSFIHSPQKQKSNLTNKIDKHSIDKAAEKVVNESYSRWQRFCYTRDDITAVVVGICQENKNK